MSLHWFPDNTVLCNFAAVGSLDRLEQVTDDREAQDYARRRGVTTRDTADLVSEAVAYGYLKRDAGYRLLQAMRAAGRFLRVPDHRDRL